MMVKADKDLIGAHFYVPRDGKDDVDVNRCILKDDERHPVAFNIHGGAFIAGDADTLDTQIDRVSKAWRKAASALRKTTRNTSRCTAKPANRPNRKAWHGKPRRRSGNGQKKGSPTNDQL